MIEDKFFDEEVVRRGTGCYKWDEEPGDDVIPMWVADMDFRTAPAITEALRRRVEHGVFGYTLVGDDYYEAVIRWFRRRHQWEIQRSWIQYTTGVVPALSVIIKAFTEPGDKVILQTPVYNCFFSSVRNNGCEVLENPLKYDANLRYEIDFDDLKTKTADPRAKLLVLCNPHNPVGRVWTKEELTRVHEICKQHGVIVVSDEIHNELVFEGRYTAYGTVSKMDNAIICTSASKSFNIAGLQMANIICANEKWCAKIDRAININEVCDVNTFAPIAQQTAYNEGEEWLDGLCAYLYDNYKTTLDFFARELPQLHFSPMEGTYLMWLDITPTGLTSEEIAERLQKEGRVQVNSGTMYGQREGEGFIRLNIACPRSRMMEGLRRIKNVMDRIL